MPHYPNQRNHSSDCPSRNSTNRPVAVCPFCESEAEWPDDILAVLTRRVVDVIPFNVRIAVSGRLSLGTQTDPETGFVSRVRLEEAEVERA